MHLCVSFFGITLSVRSIHNTVEFQKLEGLEIITLAKMWVHRFSKEGWSDCTLGVTCRACALGLPSLLWKTKVTIGEDQK